MGLREKDRQREGWGERERESENQINGGEEVAEAMRPGNMCWKTGQVLENWNAMSYLMSELFL